MIPRRSEEAMAARRRRERVAMSADPALPVALLRTFSIRRVLRLSLRVGFTALPQLALLGIVFFLPVYLLVWLLPAATPATAGERTKGLGGIGLVALLTLFVMQGAVVALVFRKLRGERPDVFASIRSGVVRCVPIVAIAIVMALMNFVGAFFVGLLVAAIHPVCMILGIFPLLILVSWSVAIPATVVERISPFQALARSAELTKGQRLRIFGALLAFAFLFLFAAILAAEVVNAVTPVASRVRTIVSPVYSALFGSFLSVWPAVVYHELRETKEGIGLDQLASVFQ